MLLFLPERFDANEWYILATTIVGYVGLYFLPKRYPHAIAVLLVLFCVSSAILYDHTIATPPLNLYDVNDWPQYEVADLFTYVMYSPYALFCVYVYDKIHPKGLWFTVYMVCWSGLSTFFEWLAVKCHVFTYRDWTLFYSFCVYLVMTTAYLWFYHYLLRRLHQQSPTAFGSPSTRRPI